MITNLSNNSRYFIFKLVKPYLIVIKKMLIIFKVDNIALKNSLKKTNFKEKFIRYI